VLLFILSLSGFASALAARIVDPVVTVIAVELAAPVALVALLASAYTLPFAVAQPILGPLGDSIGKAIVIKWAASLLALFLIVAAFAPTLPLLFISRVLAGLAGAGIIPIAFAIIGDRFPLARRQLAISRFLAASLIGQLLGASASGLLADILGWREVFLGAALITTVAALAAIFGLPADPAPPAEPIRLMSLLGRYRPVLKNPLAIICFTSVFLEGGAIYGWLPFLSSFLETEKMGGPTQAGLVTAGLGIGGLLYTLGVPLFLRFLTRPQMMLGGGIIAGLGFVGQALAPSWPIEALFMGLTGFGFFLLHNPIQTEVSELAPTARASAFALHSFSFYLGQATGPVIYSLTVPLLGAPLSLCGGGCVFACVGLFAFSNFRRGKT